MDMLKCNLTNGETLITWGKYVDKLHEGAGKGSMIDNLTYFMISIIVYKIFGLL